MPDQLDRLEALLDELEATVADDFREFVRSVNSAEVFAVIEGLLEEGKVDEALEIVDSYVVRFSNVLPAVQATAGEAAAIELGALAGQFAIAISFDPSHPRAAALARANRLLLIREFTEEQRRATRQAIGRAFELGTGTAGTARAFRGSIGLTQAQEGWVASFEQLLRNRDKRALTRALRDRRFDRTLTAAVNLDRPLTEAQIAAQVERYRARALMMRSETIARTEAVRATSLAREEALQQMLEQTGIDPARVRRKWNATRDKRTRDAHTAMAGQLRELGAPFEDGDGNRLRFPGDPLAPAATTINCRCTITVQFLEPAKTTR